VACAHAPTLVVAQITKALKKKESFFIMVNYFAIDKLNI
jgi:hypothetical protein